MQSGACVSVRCSFTELSYICQLKWVFAIACFSDCLCIKCLSQECNVLDPKLGGCYWLRAEMTNVWSCQISLTNSRVPSEAWMFQCSNNLNGVTCLSFASMHFCVRRRVLSIIIYPICRTRFSGWWLNIKAVRFNWVWPEVIISKMLRTALSLSLYWRQLSHLDSWLN